MAEKPRLYVHGDVRDDGTWYNDRTDAFESVDVAREVEVEDIRRFRFSMQRLTRLLNKTWARPTEALNLFAEHPMSKIDGRTFAGVSHRAFRERMRGALAKDYWPQRPKPKGFRL